MNITVCPREQEVFEIVSCERWPDRCPDDLRTHIASCPVCADVLEVASALHQEHQMPIDAQIPSAGLVWWRAELRVRQEALRSASRPITIVEGFGAAAAIGVAAAFLSRAWPWLKTVLTLPDFTALSATQLALVIAVTLAVLIIAPLAMYFVLSDE
jgi:hypothetical protein